MLRDFSERNKRELLDMVAQVENESICDFTDWVGDRWYDFQSLIGKLRIKNYLDNVNEYHRKVIDKNNTTKRTINQIFNRVNAIDTTYKNILSAKRGQIQPWYRFLSELKEIINPSNGRFNINSMSDVLDGILNEISVNELSACLKNYVEQDATSKEYTYHWDKIEELLSSNPQNLTDTDYQVLLNVLNTMADGEGRVSDLENLQRFINSGYTKPSQVTSDDFHISFHTLPNGQKMSYYYIQNKSYMGDTLKVILAKYGDICDSTGNQSDLNTLIRTIAENYSVIEWRQKLDYTDAFVLSQMEQDKWSGERRISQEVLDQFNGMCTPNISISLINDASDSSGLSYYQINSNAANIGGVLASISDGSVIKRNDATTDGYSDSTVRVYIDCENLNSDVVATVQQGRSMLGEYYQEFNWEQMLTDELVDVVGRIPVVGGYVSSLYNVVTQTDIEGVASSGISGIKSADLSDFSNISKKNESRIDEGLSITNQGLGIYTKYKATEKNNLTVEENQAELQKFANPLMEKQNLGLVYETMVVKYDHVNYNENGLVDVVRDCDKSSCTISPTDYRPDPKVLLHQYKTIMHKPDSFTADEPEFIDLQNEVSEYLSSGTVKEGGYLSNYMKAW